MGALPFETTELRQAGFEGILKTLRERDPPRPSTKLATLGEKTTEIAKRRRTEPRRLAGQLKGDLDWIVMRSLEKDRNRRYGSPQELAQDIRRHLEDQPVLAGPPGAAYRSRKFVKRHRVGVGIAGMISLAVVLGYVQTTVQKARIAAARDEAVLAITSLEEMLTSVDPMKSRRDVTVREMLEETAKTLGQKFKDQPLVEARLHNTVASSHYALGEYDSAEEHVRRAMEIRTEQLGEDALETLDTRNALANTTRMRGRYKEAEELARKTLETARRVLGEEHPQTNETMYELASSYWRQSRYDEAETLFVETLEVARRVHGDEHRRTFLAPGRPMTPALVRALHRAP